MAVERHNNDASLLEAGKVTRTRRSWHGVSSPSHPGQILRSAAAAFQISIVVVLVVSASGWRRRTVWPSMLVAVNVLPTRPNPRTGLDLRRPTCS